MHRIKLPFWYLWTVKKTEENVACTLLKMPLVSMVSHQLCCAQDLRCDPDCAASRKITQPNSDSNCRADQTLKKTCGVLSKGRERHKLALMSVLSCMSLVPGLNYQQGLTSDFSIRWSLVNLKDTVQISTLEGTFTYWVTSPSRWAKPRSFGGFCPWHMVKSCKGGKLVLKEENVKMAVAGQLCPHAMSEGRCSQKSLNTGQTHNWYFPVSPFSRKAIYCRSRGHGFPL